ncbi:MAG TPA: hypothetical protein VH161_04815 [Candidatus Acidoferrales bacterium]|jgi:hypothetical protein|nr:hypothetical protein [Candidatus Acidoferrales bacterium]
MAIDWRLVAGGAVLVLAVAGAAVRQYFQKPEDPENEERRRRSQLNQVGRIVEGLVVELVETQASELAAVGATGDAEGALSKAAAPEFGKSGLRRLVRYSYSIAGVTYETAQDVTGLEERLCLERIASGQPASVKYDPSNPSNSILVADDWSGLH